MAQFCSRSRGSWSFGLLAALLACGDSGGATGTEGGSEGSSGATTGDSTVQPTTSGATTSEPETAGTTGEAGSSTGGPAPELVTVGHARELRAVWIATVANINFPSEPGLGAAEQQDELRGLLDVAQATGLNAVMFQVRPESDALYASDLEPWSRFLTGEQGGDPGYDPLEVLVDEAHARGIEVHAWLNPYRAAVSKGAALDPMHIAEVLPEYAYVYDKYLWMDPGAPEVQDHLLAVIDDIVMRYDVDGIHFDDYFYPYPDGTDFPDDATWQAYKDGGGQLSRADWRRSNVDGMVQAVSESIAGLRPEVRFGISPFGIYRPGTPPGITGFDAYEGLYADPLRWMQEGWLDYLAPQLYWPIEQTAQSYATLIEWWASVTEEGRYIFAGNYLSKLGSDDVWSVDEFRQQVTLSREFADMGSQGNIFFQIEPFQSNTDGIADVMKAEFYAAPALTPPLAAMIDVAVAPPSVTLEGSTATLGHEAPATLRAWVVYAQAGDAWALDRIVPAAQASVELAPGTWAISAAGKHGVESPGVVVTAP